MTRSRRHVVASATAHSECKNIYGLHKLNMGGLTGTEDKRLFRIFREAREALSTTCRRPKPEIFIASRRNDFPDNARALASQE